MATARRGTAKRLLGAPTFVGLSTVDEGRSPRVSRVSPERVAGMG